MVKFKFKEMSGSVSVFIAKLWALTDDKNTDELIAWGQSGMSFVVFHPNIFAKQVLPKYFKHNNMTSFVRQLNMYGFRKIANIEQGSLSSENESLEFFHPYFVKGNSQLLEHIKRKPTFKSEEPKNDAISEVLSDVRIIKSRQIDLENKLEKIKLENSALWDEVLYLRDKHSKQQLIVKKLIQFLLAMISHAPNFKIKDFPLMFNNAYYNLDAQINKLKAVEQQSNDIENVPENKIIEFLNHSNKSISHLNVKKPYSDNKVNQITTDMGLPSAGLISDMELPMGQEQYYNSTMLEKNGIHSMSPQVVEDITVPSPLLEVEIDSEIINQANTALPRDYDANNISNNTIDEVSLAKNLLVHSGTKLPYDQKSNEEKAYTADVIKQINYPSALLDHIINYANNGVFLKRNNEHNLVLNKDPFIGTTSYISNDTGTLHKRIKSSNCPTPEFDEFIFRDLIDNNYIKPNDQNIIQAQSPSTDLVLANKDYHNEFNFSNLQDLLSSHNISIDTRFLMDILNNIENNEILPPHHEYLDYANESIHPYKSENTNTQGTKKVKTEDHGNIINNLISLTTPNDHVLKNGENIYNHKESNTKLNKITNDMLDKDSSLNFDFEDDDLLMESLPFLSEETFSPLLSDICSATFNEGKRVQRMNSSLYTPSLSPEPSIINFPNLSMKK